MKNTVLAHMVISRLHTITIEIVEIWALYDNHDSLSQL